LGPRLGVLTLGLTHTVTNPLQYSSRWYPAPIGPLRLAVGVARWVGHRVAARCHASADLRSSGSHWRLTPSQCIEYFKHAAYKPA
jgi:hypothetical protein